MFRDNVELSSTAKKETFATLSKAEVEDPKQTLMVQSSIS